MNSTRSICLLLCWQRLVWLLTKYLGCWQHSRLDLEWSSCWNVIGNLGLIWNEAWNWNKFFLKVFELDSNISCPWKVISWKWRRYFVELDSKCLDLERKLVERELILLSLIEICLDLDNKFVEREANFVSWILHHLAFHKWPIEIAVHAR